MVVTTQLIKLGSKNMKEEITLKLVHVLYKEATANTKVLIAFCNHVTKIRWKSRLIECNNPVTKKWRKDVSTPMGKFLFFWFSFLSAFFIFLSRKSDGNPTTQEARLGDALNLSIQRRVNPFKCLSCSNEVNLQVCSPFCLLTRRSCEY